MRRVRANGEATHTAIADEQVEVTLLDGQVLHLDVETWLDLRNQTNDGVRNAITKRLQYRSTRFDFANAGLRQRDFAVAQRAADVVLPEWTAPDALGVAPLGVPSLRFVSDTSPYGLRGDRPSNERFILGFTGNPNLTLRTIPWNDIENLASATRELLTSSLEDLYTEAMLMSGVGGGSGLRPARPEVLRFLDTAIALPAIDFDAANTALAEGQQRVRVEAARMVDPTTCRILELPGVAVALQVNPQTGQAVSRRTYIMRASHWDKALRVAGLVGLAGSSAQDVGSVGRLAVTRGHGKSMGSLNQSIAGLFAPVNGGSEVWSDGRMVANSTPLTIEERAALLATAP